MEDWSNSALPPCPHHCEEMPLEAARDPRHRPFGNKYGDKVKAIHGQFSKKSCAAPMPPYG